MIALIGHIDVAVTNHLNKSNWNCCFWRRFVTFNFTQTNSGNHRWAMSIRLPGSAPHLHRRMPAKPKKLIMTRRHTWIPINWTSANEAAAAAAVEFKSPGNDKTDILSRVGLIYTPEISILLRHESRRIIVSTVGIQEPSPLILDVHTHSDGSFPQVLTISSCSAFTWVSISTDKKKQQQQACAVPLFRPEVAYTDTTLSFKLAVE